MPKITRATQKIFGNNASANEITAFGTAMTDNPTYTTDVATIFNANFQGGWADALETDKAPFEEDTNGLIYAITKQLAYLFQQGISEWDGGTVYYTNSLCAVVENGNLIIKRSTSDNNAGNNPTTDNVNWVDFYSQKVLHTIGDPIITLNSTLNENEIWLEGATVSRTTYASLFAIYGTTYGVGDGSTTFTLPDFRNRALWGADGFGYIAAGLPNITGKIDASSLPAHAEAFGEIQSADITGAFQGIFGIQDSTQDGGSSNMLRGFNFDASRSSSIYGNSTTVQPPATKVRVKTRYQ